MVIHTLRIAFIEFHFYCFFSTVFLSTDIRFDFSLIEYSYLHSNLTFDFVLDFVLENAIIGCLEIMPAKATAD